MNGVEHSWVDSRGVRLHVAHAGQGMPVLLLHGFPENWASWTHQIRALAAAGYAAYAPDLRGYNQSDRPDAPGAYHITHLVEDVMAIIRAIGQPRVHLVGHDWGGVLAWAVADAHPASLGRLVLLNTPHMDLYVRQIRRPSRQWLRSWYVGLFRVPWLAERVLASRDFRVLRDMFSDWPALPAFTAAEVDGYIAALARPGALTAALRWYRDNADADAVARLRRARATMPTLVIWGEQDRALGVELLDGLEHYASSLHIHRVAAASHWVQREAPSEVNRALLAFLAAADADPGATRSSSDT